MHRSSKPEWPFERTAWGVRFPCSTEEKHRRKETASDVGSRRPVATERGRFSPSLAGLVALIFTLSCVGDTAAPAPRPGSATVTSIDDVDAGVRCYVWVPPTGHRGGISCLRLGGQ